MDWHKAGEEKKRINGRGKIEVYYLAGLVGFFPVFFALWVFLRGAKQARLFWGWFWTQARSRSQTANMCLGHGSAHHKFQGLSRYCLMLDNACHCSRQFLRCQDEDVNQEMDLTIPYRLSL